MAKDTFYFSHDYNVRNDSKIKKLLSVHGYLGYGLWWAIVEDLYNNTNVLRIDYESISFDLRTSTEIIKSIINDFDLFVFDGENFGSLSVQKRLDERNEKSNKARNSVLKRWANKGIDTNVLQSQFDSNTIKESKGKEKKGNKKNIFNFSFALISFGFEKQLVEDWLKVRKNKKGTNTETAFKEFIAEVEKTKADKNAVLKHCIVKNWVGYKSDWYKTELPQERKMIR